MGPPTTRGGPGGAGDSHPVAGPTPCGVATGRSAAEDRWRGARPGTAGTRGVEPGRPKGGADQRGQLTAPLSTGRVDGGCIDKELRSVVIEDHGRSCSFPVHTGIAGGSRGGQGRAAPP